MNLVHPDLCMIYNNLHNNLVMLDITLKMFFKIITILDICVDIKFFSNSPTLMLTFFLVLP